MDAYTIMLASSIVALLCIHLARKARYRNVTVRRIHHFDNLQISSISIYGDIKAVIKRLRMPQVKIREVIHAEGGIVGGSRVYLRVSYRSTCFDICAAPFGYGYFISWYQKHRSSICHTLVATIPLFERLLYQKTYYQTDTEEIFAQRVHQIMTILIRDLKELECTNEKRRQYAYKLMGNKRGWWNSGCETKGPVRDVRGQPQRVLTPKEVKVTKRVNNES